MSDERIDLANLAREEQPPAAARERIAAELRRQGLLRRRRPLIAFAAAAAIAAAVIAAFLMREQRVEPPSPQYILLLYESPQFSGGSREEYGKWASQMRPRVVGGEELGSNDVMAISGRSTALPLSSPRLTGYFLIRARDDAGAAAVAKACPHVRHGGAVVLRRIVQ